jgi:O-antigen/teichoic acid export membrane protein
VFHLPPQFVDIARVAALIGGVSAAVSLISGVFGGILIGLQRFDYDNALEIAVGAVRVVAIVVVLKEGQGLVVLAAVQLGANVLRGMANYWAVRHLYPELRARVRWDAPYLRMILTFGVSVSLLEFVSSVHLYSSALVIGALLPVGAITFYAIGGTLMEGARSVVNGIAWVVTPMASASEGRGDQPGVRAAILGAARFASLAVLPIVVTFLLRGHSFVSLWMGESYSAVSGNVLQVLAVALWPIACYQVITAGMVGVGRLAGLIPILLVEVACILGLSILWVGDFGVIGAAWGSTLPRVVTSVVAGPWYLRRTVGVSLRTFWGPTLLLPSLAMLPFAAASYAMEQLWPAESLVSYFAQVMLSLPLAAAGGWFVCFSRAERVALIQRWRFRLRRGDVDSAG